MGCDTCICYVDKGVVYQSCWRYQTKGQISDLFTDKAVYKLGFSLAQYQRELSSYF